MRKKLLILTVALTVAGICLTGSAVAQQHDYQDWNLMSIGRIVTFARTNSCVQDKTPPFTCGIAASHEAMAKVEDVLTTFDCTSYVQETVPEVSQAKPFSRYDHGPVIVAEVDDVSCRTLPSTQLMPVDPDEFKMYCSRLEWKCDVVWVPDSDPSVWYIGVLADIPQSHRQ